MIGARRLIYSLFLLVVIVAAFGAVPARAITAEELKARIEQSTKGFSDITMTAVVINKDKKALSKVDPTLLRLYDFNSVTIMHKHPDKVRGEGKLGAVKVEFIINGNNKLFRVPALRVNKKEDCKEEPAKLLDALDIGLVTPSLWRNRRITILDDPKAKASGEIELRLTWPTGGNGYVIWLDAKDLWLKRSEKRSGEDTVQAVRVYSNPKKVGTVWVPTKIEMFAPDGSKAGTTEMSGIAVNTNLADKLFE